jgi:hypothetical protein
MLDGRIWAAIAIMTFLNSRTDIEVIHRGYTLGPKHTLNILVHQFIILMAILGILFVDRSSIQAHLFVLSVCVVCWLWFKGCFMHHWQLKNIPYKETDIRGIHGTTDGQLLNFMAIIVPGILIDVYKLGYL